MDILNVFVTTGTGTNFNFIRLLNILVDFCEEGILDGNSLVVQCTDNFHTNKFKYFKFFSNSEFLFYMDQADLIISHAGTGSVISGLNLRKKLILFPRLKQYNEHTDNHQLDICELFEKNGFVLVAKSKIELKIAIKETSSFVPKTFKSNKNNFNLKLINLIKEWI